jgi:inhibitor of KinA sporulation pathway (predicted exonuclease)
MRYIIMDLEWNNTYGRKINGFINEVIEIGAVKLDENLNSVDTFSHIVKSQIGKKLRGSVKRLTNITNEDLDGGIPFTKAFSDFRSWIGPEENVVLTWGDGDIRVLIDNYRYLNGIATIPFLTNYADLQKLFQNVLKTPASKQIGLASAAQLIGIADEDYASHRALDDSLLSAECFRKCFDAEQLDKLKKKCDASFYSRLSFKAYAITNINNPLVDKSMLSYSCEFCEKETAQITEWKNTNQYFRAVFYCPDCGKKFKVGVRFKKSFDKLDVRKVASIFEESEESDDESKLQEVN